MTRLSVNVNKVALLRNARGGNMPDLVEFVRETELAGAQGITVHPRPDERHVRIRDVYQLKEMVQTEFNIEGYPTAEFLKMIEEVKPAQCTLVPDTAEQLTSDHGWDVIRHFHFLEEVIARLKAHKIRVSLFADPDLRQIDQAAAAGADRIELYTGPYALAYAQDREAAVSTYRGAALHCQQLNIGLNAGHDLNLHNLAYFANQCPGLLEVSIGHALIRDCLYYGLNNTIALYLRCLNEQQL
jgi:pyridoxine 5-phosphate synthase